MNKHEPEREKMLAEAFHGEWSAGLAAGMARRAAAVARRRHAGRRALFATGTAAGIAAALILSLRHPAVMPRENPAAENSTPAYEIISDDELLAQLKDQPLLVIRGENGAREFVLLDP